jgi:hypothetical protein
MKFRFEFSVFNALNSSTVTNIDSVLHHSSYGQLHFDHDADIFKGFNTKNLMKAQELPQNPTFGWANAFQAPRYARIQLSFFF